MKTIIDESHEGAKEHFLKPSSYFSSDLPVYISFKPILNAVAKVLDGKSYMQCNPCSPRNCDGVNYSMISNKDGKFAWRPLS